MMRQLLHRVQWLGLLLLCAVLSFPQPGDASGLIRLTDRDDLFGWEAVGRVDIDGNGYCTGVLITPDLVLTAAHCVFADDNQQVAPAQVTFRAGLRDGVAIAERDVRRIVAAPGYRPGAGLIAENVRNDAALLELDTQILSSVAAPFVIHESARPGDRVSVVSYGRDRDQALSWQRDCGVLQRGSGWLAFDCNVTFGSSGAPVFYRDGRRARILSLVSGGRFENGSTVVAYGMELPALVHQLKRQLRALPTAPVSGAKFQRVDRLGGNNGTGAKFARPNGS